MVFEQEVFELQLITVEPTFAVLVTPRGEHLTISASEGDTGEMGFEEFHWQFLIKDLGIRARLHMGLPGYTEPWKTTRVVHEGEYMPMHLPVAALCPEASWYRTARHYCTFCCYGLRNSSGKLGAFKVCWFCKDRPTTHHGACCPHNPASREWNGTPHWQKHRKNMRKFLSTLPF